MIRADQTVNCEMFVLCRLQSWQFKYFHRINLGKKHFDSRIHSCSVQQLMSPEKNFYPAIANPEAMNTGSVKKANYLHYTAN